MIIIHDPAARPQRLQRPHALTLSIPPRTSTLPISPAHRGFQEILLCMSCKDGVPNHGRGWAEGVIRSVQ